MKLDFMDYFVIIFWSAVILFLIFLKIYTKIKYKYNERNNSYIVYTCKKCQITKYFKPNEVYTKCKICGNEMEGGNKIMTYPKDALDTIKKHKKTPSHNVMNNTINNPILSTPIVECPYCHSTNTKKITLTSKAAHTAMFGIFSVSRNSKQFHCNNCKADF